MTVVNTQELQAKDSAHFIHPFTDTKSLAARGARIITHGEGVYVYDSNNEKILDAMSGLWCVNMGYGQQSIIDAATEQLKVLPFYNSFFNTTTPPSVELASLLAQVAPEGFSHVFYSSSGSESNDTNLRMVRRYWDIKGQKQRKTVISRKNAYHGSTVAGASLGGMTGMHEQGDLPIPGIVHIEQPYYRENGMKLGVSEDEFGIIAAGWLEEKILEVGPDKVAAFIGEPVQGAGGVIIPPKTYWPEIQRICDKYGVLIISDEVICGFGRLGTWFGCETMGFKPDLITFAKGVTSGYIPLGGVLVGDRVAKVLIEEGGEFNHGYTYSGHPVACAVAMANIKLMQEHDIVNQVKNDTAPYLKEKFESLNDHPLVADARTLGLVGGFELLKNKETGERFDESIAVGMICRGHCFGNGLVMRAVGDRMIIAPPLVISHAEIDELVDLARKALDATLADLKERDLY
ncbi:MAG: aspartate aminotransferase family protein [Burkholderiaceae bacterium]